MLRTYLTGLVVVFTLLYGQVAFSGTEDTLAKFGAGGQPDTDSICSDDGSTLTVDGYFEADGLRTFLGASYPNVVGGASNNSIGGTVNGSVIAGGRTNSVWHHYAAILGGYVNQVYQEYSSICGGYSNEVSYDAGVKYYQFIGGGYNNTANGHASTIAGGYSNATSDTYATVGGGHGNTASGQAAAVAGGYNCIASGDESFAVGLENEATGASSVAMGVDSIASGVGSTALGRFARANGTYQMVLGADPDGTCSLGGSYNLAACFDDGVYFDLDGAQLYVDGDVRADDFIEYSPYPDSLETAYQAIFSMQRLPDGEYDPENTRNQLDHSKLHPFIRRLLPAGVKDPDEDQTMPEVGCSISAVVGSHNEVIKDLVNRIEQLESRVQQLEAACPNQ